MIKVICLYSPVKNLEVFSKVGFYRDDLCALKKIGNEVVATNSLKIIFNKKPKLTVGYFYGKSLFAAILTRILGGRVVLTGGGDQISPNLVHGNRLVIQRLFAFLCILFSNKILLSCVDDVKNFNKICLGLSCLKSKLEFSPHVVHPSVYQRLNNNGEKGVFKAFTICWMGSIGNVQRKGVDKSILLISMLKKKGIQASLSIAGTEGPGLKYLKDLVKEHSLQDSIEFLGQISEDEKNRWYSSDAAYLQLSTYEGFGVAAAEAFFSGMVVVHSNRGGLSDVIGENGLIVDIEKFKNINNFDIDSFYDNFLSFKPPYELIKSKLHLYSIENRAKSFQE